jgi:hypothetical protein
MALKDAIPTFFSLAYCSVSTLIVFKIINYCAIAASAGFFLEVSISIWEGVLYAQRSPTLIMKPLVVGMVGISNVCGTGF